MIKCLARMLSPQWGICINLSSSSPMTQGSENIIEEGLEERAECCDMLPPGHGYHPPELTVAVACPLASQPGFARPQPLLKSYWQLIIANQGLWGSRNCASGGRGAFGRRALRVK